MSFYAPPIMTPFATIHCPSCNGAAKFAFATYKIIEKKDVKYFKKSKNFELFKGQHSHGSFYTAALYYHGLGNSLENINDLPDGYETKMWRLPCWHHTLPKELKNTGSIRCTNCLLQTKHLLNWPSDAYFQITYKGKVLWAFDRKYTLKLLSYLESKERKKTIVGYSGKPWNTIVSQDWFLRHIPEHFQTAKARPEIVKKLRSILGINTESSF